MLAVSMIVVGRLREDRSNWRHHGPPLAVLLTGFVWVASLSAWFSPFGWITYGPRLEVPLLGGLAIAALHLVGADVLAALRSSRAAAGVMAVGTAWGCLQFAAPWRYSAAIDQLLAGDSTCAGLITVDVNRDAPEYFRCASHVMWRLRPAVVDEMLGVSASVRGLSWLLGVLGCVLLAVSIRRRQDSGGVDPDDVKKAQSSSA